MFDRYKIENWCKDHLLIGKKRIYRGIYLYRTYKITKEQLYKKYLKTERLQNKYRGNVIRAGVRRKEYEKAYRYYAKYGTI